MLHRYLFGAALICFIADIILTFSIFFLMIGKIIPFGPPPYWLAYGALTALWLATLGLISFAAS